MSNDTPGEITKLKELITVKILQQVQAQRKHLINVSHFKKVNSMAPEPIFGWLGINFYFFLFFSFPSSQLSNSSSFPWTFSFPWFFSTPHHFFPLLPIFPLFFYSLLPTLTLLNPFLMASSPVRIRLWLKLSIKRLIWDIWKKVCSFLIFTWFNCKSSWHFPL